MDIIYDLETYPNVFIISACVADAPITWAFEVSDWRDDCEEIRNWLMWMKESQCRMVGFNNLGFDYPILHLFTQRAKVTAKECYDKAQAIFQDETRFGHLVYPSDRYVEQIDLYKIHHFDNKARATGLKVLEFNMRLDNVSDLPFPPGTVLTQDQMRVLKEYNAHDVLATQAFYVKSLEKIAFREQLTREHDRDFMNASDVKIGKDIFQQELERAGVQCYEYSREGRRPRQTRRQAIRLADCIPSFVEFQHPEFRRVRDWLSTQVISETKGVFNDLTATVGGLHFVFGTGGIHASVENRYFESDDQHHIVDIDVTSLYPSIAIEQGYYPEHLGPTFVHVYRRLREQRVSYKKGTAQNAMLKLALNGVYGASGDQFSIFYDPLFTMKITIGGQMMIAMLVERLASIDGVQIIQCNTDGVSIWKRAHLDIDPVLTEWEALTRLHLERVMYQKMAIRDVNSYLAVDIDGKVKRIGAYEYDLDWNQNHSALVVPKVAEKVIVQGLPIRDTIMNWPDRMDFMGRVKVTRGHRLVGVVDGQDHTLENTQRYYVSKGGVQLVKVMPPLAKTPTKVRRVGVESGWTVCCCNDIRDAALPIDYEYYIKEVEKLCLSLM